MNTETYLNHPTFGLLFRVCPIGENQELFTTLYAQRLFFVVTNDSEGFRFEPIARGDARTVVENRLRQLRRMKLQKPYEQLHAIRQQMFQ
ncbi:MAG: PipX family protein [Cyanobacteria bacterium SID2]|nr:PipX family protein [Cyanobacteria bacterium SID2]MBP0004642.1 PipX family protein [Cyanobacteria bacterium SBC]